MKMNKEIKETITKGIIDDAFSKKMKRLNGELYQAVVDVVRKNYQDRFGWVEDAIGYLKHGGFDTAGMFRSFSGLSVRAKGFTYSTKIEVKLVPEIKVPGGFAHNLEDIQYFQSDDDIEVFGNYVNELSAIDYEKKTLREDILKVLNQVSTIERLRKEIPEWAKFIPEIHANNVPAIKYDSVLDKISGIKGV